MHTAHTAALQRGVVQVDVIEEMIARPGPTQIYLQVTV
jgi:hypothetical protein